MVTNFREKNNQRTSSRKTIQRSKEIVLLHANALPHSARVIRDLAEKILKLEQCEHPQISLRLITLRFSCICRIKEALTKERFGNDERV